MSDRPTDVEAALRVPCEQLRWSCDPSALDFESTAELEPEYGIIGQGEAIDALRFGLELYAPGQNVYVRGLEGSGRMALVRRVLREIQPACPLAMDCGYVTNFDKPSEPRLVQVARGRGADLRDALEGLIRFLREDLGPALASEDIVQRRQYLDEALQKEVTRLSRPFEEELAANGLAMVQAKVGNTVRQMVLPVIDGEPAPPEKLRALQAEGELDEDELEALSEKVATWVKKLEGLSRELRDVGLAHARDVRELVERETRALVEAEVAPLREAFPTKSVARFFDALVQDVLRRGVEDLLSEPAGMRRYRLALIGGHEPDEPCPVVIERTPTLANLLGTIERRPLPEGGAVSDHLMIQGGSLLRADGGYLILEARDVLREPGAWKVLTRTLRTGQLEIVPSELSGPWGPPGLKPEPIPVQVKVILIGDPGLYYALDATDPDFPALFKVLADFESEMPRGDESLQQYGRLLARIAQEESLPHFHRTAVAALAEHGARIAGRNDRLTTRFGRLADLAREAGFLASRSTRSEVHGEHVREAVRRSKRRADLPARKFRRHLAEGTIHVQVEGRVVGQVNGLAVLSAGPLTYGFPCRITATIGAGHAGAINIERESQLSGAIHTKGFYILGGLLRHLLHTRHPLAFSASIAFEQSYGGIDGDSASGAEICCLLSALTGIPLRQGLAMTGAIDQHGRILPIGAVTEKIEGFYDACSDLGLTGDQGVVVPRANLTGLMLRHDVAEACTEGRFHVYAVGTIQEALALFTGMEAGERDGDGEYGEETLLALAVERAGEYWSLASGREPGKLEEVEEEGEAEA